MKFRIKYVIKKKFAWGLFIFGHPPRFPFGKGKSLPFSCFMSYRTVILFSSSSCSFARHKFELASLAVRLLSHRAKVLSAKA